jgi:hypothetical protein
MDQQIEDRFRVLTAQTQAISFVVEYLLRHAFLTLPRGARLRLAENLLEASKDTSHFSNIAAGDDLAAEYLADVAIQTQGAIDRIIGKTLRITAEVEDEANAQLGAQGRD